MPLRNGRPRGLKTDGPKIRRLRVEHGLTMNQLADRLGVNQESIRRAERGGPLGDVTAGRIAKVLGVKLSDIAEWPGDDEDTSEPETPHRISA